MLELGLTLPDAPIFLRSAVTHSLKSFSTFRELLNPPPDANFSRDIYASSFTEKPGAISSQLSEITSLPWLGRPSHLGQGTQTCGSCMVGLSLPPPVNGRPPASHSPLAEGEAPKKSSCPRSMVPYPHLVRPHVRWTPFQPNFYKPYFPLLWHYHPCDEYFTGIKKVFQPSLC